MNIYIYIRFIILKSINSNVLNETETFLVLINYYTNLEMRNNSHMHILRNRCLIVNNGKPLK